MGGTSQRVCHLPSSTWSGWTHGSDRNGNDRGVITHLFMGDEIHLPETQMGPLVLLEVWALVLEGSTPQNRGRSQVPGTYIGVKNFFF